MYFCGDRVSREVPLFLKTIASTVKQYPSQRGKNPQCVLSPWSDQLMNQKMTMRNIPIHPCRAKFFIDDREFMIFKLTC